MTDTISARSFFTGFAAGKEPNGIKPSDCGEWAGLAGVVWDTYQVHGVGAAQQTVRGMLNDPKQSRGLAALMADGATVESLRPISAKDLMAMRFAPIKWAVPGLIPEGVTLLAGRPKSGKSWVCLDLAIAIATGGYALGKARVQRGDVLYLALEDTMRRLQSRLDRLLRNGSIPSGLDLVTRDQKFPRLDKGGLSWIGGWAETHPKARLIAVDTLAKIRPDQQANKSLYDQDYESVEGLLQLTGKYNIPLTLIHHTRKAKADDALEEVSGSYGLTGAVDEVIVMKREQGKVEATLAITGRDVEEQTLALTWDATSTQWIIAGNIEDFKRSHIRELLLSIIHDAGHALSPMEVHKIAVQIDPDISYDVVKQRLYQMRQDRLLVAEDGKYDLPKRAR